MNTEQTSKHIFNSFSSQELFIYFSRGFSVTSICVFSLTFCVSAAINCTKRFSLSYKTESQRLLKSSEISLIAGNVFILTGVLSGKRQFLASESPSKMMKNVFLFHL